MEGFNSILLDIKNVCDEFLGKKYKLGNYWEEIKEKSKKKNIELLYEKNTNYERIAQTINKLLLDKITNEKKIKEFIETNSFRINIFSIFIKRKIGKKNENKFCLNCCPNIIGEGSIDGYYCYENIIKSEQNKNIEFYLNIIITGLRI